MLRNQQEYRRCLEDHPSNQEYCEELRGDLENSYREGNYDEENESYQECVWRNYDDCGPYEDSRGPARN